MDTILMNFENSKTYDPQTITNKNLVKNWKNWNEKFELPDGSYSVSDIQDCSENILKNHEIVTILQ